MKSKILKISICGIILFLGFVWFRLFSLLLKQDHKNELFENVDDTSHSVQYTDEGVYLINTSGDKLSGPYKMIEENDLGASYGICRYIGNNGLIGYISTADGKEITAPIYIKATRMMDGSACVKESDGRIYYIKSSGEKITNGYYIDGYPFAESQGCYARVQMEDERWAIINKNEDILVSGLDYINTLPYVTNLGSGVRSGHALLFSFSYETDDELEVVQEYEEFCDISEVYSGEFAVVKNERGLCGVVCGWNGEIVIPAVYTFIDWDRVLIDEDSYECMTTFKAQRSDGTYDIITWNPWDKN